MKPDERSALRIDQHTAPDHVVLEMEGVLDGTTYRVVRDAVVKTAIDQPPVLAIDVTRLCASSPSAWSVFTSARWLVGQWPDIPMGLACAHVAKRREIVRNGLVRYLPVYGDVAVAIAALTRDAPIPRRRVRQRWPAAPLTLPATREFVSHWLGAWGLDALIPTAMVVTTALVDNVLKHTDSEPDLRLESDGSTVTVAVTDDSPTPAGVREDADAAGALTELMIVDALTIAWGNAPTDVGKVVWAVMGPQNRL